MANPAFATKELLLIDSVLRKEKRKARDGQPLTQEDIDGLSKEMASQLDTSPQATGPSVEVKMEKKGKYAGEITIRITGIPAKDADEALEKFRKFIGNQLRDADSKVRKQFLKTAKITLG